MIDKTKDGRFTLEEIEQFATLYYERPANTNTVDVVKEFQGYCTASLWNYVTASPEGKETFIRWFGLLFSRGHEVPTPKGAKSDTKFVDRNAVMLIHSILNISKSYAMEGSQTLNLFQGVSKQKKLLPPGARPDIVPVEVLESFGEEFISGFINYMTELGFTPGMDIH